MLEGWRIVTFSTPQAKQTRLERAGFDVRAQSKTKEWESCETNACEKGALGSRVVFFLNSGTSNI